MNECDLNLPHKSQKCCPPSTRLPLHGLHLPWVISILNDLFCITVFFCGGNWLIWKVKLGSKSLPLVSPPCCQIQWASLGPCLTVFDTHTPFPLVWGLFSLGFQVSTLGFPPTSLAFLSLCWFFLISPPLNVRGPQGSGLVLISSLYTLSHPCLPRRWSHLVSGIHMSFVCWGCSDFSPSLELSSQFKG